MAAVQAAGQSHKGERRGIPIVSCATRALVGPGARRLVDRDLHRGARLADRFEISARAEPRTSTVLVPLAVDQSRRGHQVEHPAHDIAVEPRRGTLAVFGIAALILRPQPMHHEGIGTAAALRLGAAPVVAAFARRLAEGRRPGQRQHVEIESARRVLAMILRGCVRACQQQRGRDESERSQPPAQTSPTSDHENAPTPYAFEKRNETSGTLQEQIAAGRIDLRYGIAARQLRP